MNFKDREISHGAEAYEVDGLRQGEDKDEEIFDSTGSKAAVV